MTYIDFKKRLITDADFAEKFIKCKTPEALVEAAAREGYIFTVDDIKNNTELIPEELELAAGGLWVNSSTVFIINNSRIVTK